MKIIASLSPDYLKKRVNPRYYSARKYFTNKVTKQKYKPDQWADRTWACFFFFDKNNTSLNAVIKCQSEQEAEKHQFC